MIQKFRVVNGLEHIWYVRMHERFDLCPESGVIFIGRYYGPFGYFSAAFTNFVDVHA